MAEQPEVAREQAEPFKRGDVVMHKKYGLAVVYGLYGPKLLQVIWILTNPNRSRFISYRTSHPEFDMQTAAENFTKIGEVPDGDV